MAISTGKQKGKYSYEIIDGDGFIPPGTKVVDTAVFKENKELEKVKIPKSVISILPGTFLNCTNLESIEIDSSISLLKYIGDRGVFSMSDYPPFPNLIDVVVNKGWTVSLFKSPSQDPHFWD
jgi:hypothetical protein